ncbi:peptidylprolyl isomerase [Flavobacterium sp. NKUCC04_CG]|uniref:peptidylprolyl isomerase n=1 Tax=Flavobacterium sp. NKUCC04_CG TaxID=2842121 RepID=UPI001C5A986B|nr:peptidylprolyl isomerase [Flavobacterium sp. NKUCC04_CG]MBW3520356.1 peptidyl-prolyl cis-trans isomerase [Flavobacterium sp. NKUCC04_CG]
MIRFAFLIMLLLSLNACKDKTFRESDAVARVNDSYLYRKDLDKLVAPGTSKEDSVVIVQNYLNHWATQQLLLDVAEFNLTDQKKTEIQELVNQFKTDLMTAAYLERMVQQSVDTVVSDADLRNFYQTNKDKFISNEVLVQLRYVNVLNENPKLPSIKKYFLSNKKQDFKKLEDLSLQMKSYAFNDSVWVNLNQIYGKLPFITAENIKSYLADGLFYEIKDSESTYMVKVNKVLDKNSISPFDYIKPTLVQTLMNNRKMELIKKIQKDILDDANKNNQYEIYK